MKKILFIVPRMCFDRPREIRAKRFIDAIPGDFEVHLLTFDYGKRIVFERNVTVHYVKYGWFSKYLINQESLKFGILYEFIRKVLAFFIRRFFFPDTWKIEIPKLIKHLSRIIAEESISHVITSVVPFSMLALGPTIKKHKCEWIIDMGDPLFKNSINQTLFSSRAYCYEERFLKNCDHLIVTNDETRKHYLASFPSIQIKMHVIPQGALVPLLQKVKRGGHGLGSIYLLTYAGTFYKGLREPTNLFGAVASYEKAPIRLEVYPKPYGFSNPCPEKISYLSPVTNDLIIEKYLESDVLVYLDNASGLQSSGKIYELLACRKPILFIYSNENSPVKKVVTGFSGIFFAKNDQKAIEQAIDKAIGNLDKIDFDFPVETLTWGSRAKDFLKAIGLAG